MVARGDALVAALPDTPDLGGQTAARSSMSRRLDAHPSVRIVLGRVLAVTALALGACGDDAASSGGDATTTATSPSDATTSADVPQSDNFRARMQSAQCDYNIRCGQLPASVLDACKASAVEFATHPYAMYDENEAIAAGRLVLDTTLLDACIASLGATGCTSEEVPSAFVPCNEMLKGRVQNGDTCYSSNECAAGYCKRASLYDGCPGVCEAYLAVGAACEPTEYRCPKETRCDQVCDGDGCAYQCAPRRAENESCEPGNALAQCAFDLQCQGYVDADHLGTCKHPPKSGEPCAIDDSSYRECAPGLLCDKTQAIPTCGARLPAGSPCDTHSDCADGLGCDGAVYDFGTHTATPKGVCKTWIQAGGACTPPPTRGSSACVNGSVCDPDKKVCNGLGGVLGDDCGPQGTHGDCWIGTYCDDATKKCLRPIAAGEACAPVFNSEPIDSCYDYGCNDGICGRSCE